MTRSSQIGRSLIVVAVLLLLATSSWTQDAAVGSRGELKATNPLGVPLHRQARSSLFGRAADGTIGTVIDLQNQNRWLNLTLPDGRTGWIVSGYVGRVLPPGSASAQPCQ
jgi:hypothetical protein